MHIYPQDYKSSMLKQWIKNAIDDLTFCIDIRFNVPDDMDNIKSKHRIQIELVYSILGEISQMVLIDNRVNGSITFVGTTATIFIMKQ